MILLEDIFRSPKLSFIPPPPQVHPRVHIVPETCPPQPDEKGPFVSRNKVYLWPWQARSLGVGRGDSWG